MSRYANPWSGGTQFYKGKPRRLPTARSDKEYQKYCAEQIKKAAKKNTDPKVLPYIKWCKRERARHGMF